MKIEKDTAVTLHLTITDAAGKPIDTGSDPMVYLHGGYENTLPKIEEALEGQEAGYQVKLTLSPEDSFGERNEALITTIAKKDFPPGVKVGGQLQGRGEDGEDHVFTVMKIKGDTVHLDGNHPFAGKTLCFAIKVMEVRAASAEEIAHKHVHGAHGHHH